ncbi:SDR family oxidoreductase [Antarctobacter jejuensis]|uniref:SDR family oxidoreductase n=1 Tax=Antarctobacter jejuensis TaxID=1439938 RepID=UPI003FD54D62
MTQPQTVLVLGAYGLIGSAVCRSLRDAGHRVIAAGRSADMARRVLPDLPFRHCDMAQLTESGDWAALLEGVGAVVNCAGSLQDTPGNDLEALHHHALAALGAAAAQSGVRVVQVSAVGASPAAKTAFMSSKGRGDVALAGSGARHVILRPGLVLARGAYGGTMLLRMLAAVPLIQPLALPDSPVQSVALDEVAEAVRAAVDGDLPDGAVFDLVEDESQPLHRVVADHRHALGFAPARLRLTLPAALLPLVGRVADGLGRLGWRSPLRTTAITVLRDGVTGDPAPWRMRFGALSPLTDTLQGMTLGAEHRLQARAALLMPICVAVLSLFWALSGLIGLWQIGAAADHLTAVGWSRGLARISVAFWSFVDLALALSILYRPTARLACLEMVGVSLIYLVSATIFTPAMWADPLGPLVKVLPAMVLALVTWVLLEER